MRTYIRKLDRLQEVSHGTFSSLAYFKGSTRDEPTTNEKVKTFILYTFSLNENQIEVHFCHRIMFIYSSTTKAMKNFFTSHLGLITHLRGSEEAGSLKQG